MEGKNCLPKRQSCNGGPRCHQLVCPLMEKMGIDEMRLIENLVEHKHEEGSKTSSHRIHHDVGHDIDGGGDGGEGQWHPSHQGQGGHGGRGRGKDAEHVLQGHP